MIRAILTDIEGTTSSISFVKEVLFPYAAAALPDFVRQHRGTPQVEGPLAEVAREASLNLEDTEALIACLLHWIAQDRKITALKTLQGMVWQYGYEQGAYQAHVYPDAVARLRQWHADGMGLYVYSSGSVFAQKLFFRYSAAGDLTPLFSGYFDTTAGPKQAAGSYRNIAQAIGLPFSDILFLSDIEAELDAARETGMGTWWLLREQDSPFHPGDVNSPHPVATDFSQIRF